MSSRWTSRSWPVSNRVSMRHQPAPHLDPGAAEGIGGPDHPFRQPGPLGQALGGGAGQLARPQRVDQRDRVVQTHRRRPVQPGLPRPRGRTRRGTPAPARTGTTPGSAGRREGRLRPRPAHRSGRSHRPIPARRWPPWPAPCGPASAGPAGAGPAARLGPPSPAIRAGRRCGAVPRLEPARAGTGHPR